MTDLALLRVPSTISEAEADVLGMPVSFYERAVRFGAGRSALADHAAPQDVKVKDATSTGAPVGAVPLDASLPAGAAPASVSPPANCVTDAERGTRLVGPHGGLKETMPSPTDADLFDPVFETIWQATKTWDVNAPEYYTGYCGMNGSHVMLILNALRNVSVSPQAPTGEYGWLIENGEKGDKLRYRYVNQGMPDWTPDANLAIRFARRVDAEQFAAEDEDAWRIVEHGWHDRGQGEPAAGADWVRVSRETLSDVRARLADLMQANEGGSFIQQQALAQLDSLLSAAPRPDAQEVPVGESRWLIERTYAKGKPAEKRQFWLGITRHGMHSDSFEDGIDSMGYSVWTDNAVEAARFSSRKIADSLRYHNFHPEAPVEAVEHLFQCGVTRPDAGEGPNEYHEQLSRRLLSYACLETCAMPLCDTLKEAARALGRGEGK